MIRFEPYDRNFWDKLFRVLLCDAHIFEVPSTAFKVKATDQSTVLHLLNFKASVCRSVNVKNLWVVVSWIFLVQKFEFEV